MEKMNEAVVEKNHIYKSGGNKQLVCNFTSNGF